jgi:hypothetical protein
MFAMADRYFCSVLSQTFPNRFYLLAGTSFGHIRNDFPSARTDYAQRTIFNVLDEAGVSWKIYYGRIPFALLFAYVRGPAGTGKLVPVQQFTTDAHAGALPQVAFVDPIFLASANVETDEHPPSNVQVGQAFVSSVVGAFLESPQWAHGALFLTYDEHGGYFDRVSPPPACAEALRLPPRVRPHLDPPLHRDAVRPSRTHAPERERRSATAALQVQPPGVPDAADVAAGDDRSGAAGRLQRRAATEPVRTFESAPPATAAARRLLAPPHQKGGRRHVLRLRCRRSARPDPAHPAAHREDLSDRTRGALV